jgi:dTDP-4-amino-4,6-dideoxygalactose transaminase
VTELNDPLGNTEVYHCLSFNNNKILTTGAGGAVIGSGSAVENIKDRNRQGSYTGVGSNKGMASLNAEMGWKKMVNGTFILDVARKRAMYDKYFEELHGKVSFQNQIHGNRWYTSIRFPTQLMREGVMSEFKKREIPVRFPFMPFRYGNVASEYYAHGLCLPMGTQMLYQHQDEVIKIIQGVCENYA